MKKILTTLLMVSLVVPGFAAQSAEDLAIVRGEHWVESSLEQKRAYLFGIGNVLEIEQAMNGDDYESMRGRSIVPVLLDGLSGVSIADMVTQLDAFYAVHTDQLARPVIEVLYLEMAMQKLQENKE